MIPKKEKSRKGARCIDAKKPAYNAGEIDEEKIGGIPPRTEHILLTR